MSFRHTHWIAAVTLAPLVSAIAAAAGTPPVCDAGGPYFAAEGDGIMFDATGSMDPDGVIVEYVWDFGDGTGASGPEVEHVYASAGIYTVVLGVADDDGNVSSCETTADVEGEVPDLPQDMTLDDYVADVAHALPMFDVGILAATPGPDWLAGVKVEDVAASMDDEVPATTLFEHPVWIGYDAPDSTNSRYVKIDFARGYVRYLSQPRQFEWGDSQMGVPDDVALSVFFDAMDALGLPSGEWSSARVDLVLESGWNEDTGEETTLEVEQLVTLTRVVNGYPVLGSLARMAVSNQAEAARTLVEWPRFRLVDDPELLSRDEVVQEIAERIWQAEAGVDVRLDVLIGYAPTAAGFVPVAQVGFSDREGVLEGGAIELVPLVSAPTIGVSEDATLIATSLRTVATGRGRVSVEFVLPSAAHAVVVVYDAVGRRVRTLLDRNHEAGHHTTIWDGRSDTGLRLASGMYFVRLETESAALSDKITLLW